MSLRLFVLVVRGVKTQDLTLGGTKYILINKAF